LEWRREQEWGTTGWGITASFSEHANFQIPEKNFLSFLNSEAVLIYCSFLGTAMYRSGVIINTSEKLPTSLSTTTLKDIQMVVISDLVSFILVTIQYHHRHHQAWTCLVVTNHNSNSFRTETGLKPWRWRQHVIAKRRHPPTRLHDVNILQDYNLNNHRCENLENLIQWHKKYYVLGYNAVYSCVSSPTFHKKALPLSTGWKNKPSTKPKRSKTQTSCWAYFSTLKMKAVRSPETSMYFYRTTWCYILEDSEDFSRSSLFEPQIHVQSVKIYIKPAALLLCLFRPQ
jgi:hypothetical protein